MQPGRNETIANPRRLPPPIERLRPSHRCKDLVLPSQTRAQLQEAVHALKLNASQRQPPAILLFTGANGTGKTVAAHIIAGDLGLDVFRISLRAVVSKYIGETEKHLANIFGEAEKSNAILFFEEADALFGKRSGRKAGEARYVDCAIRYMLRRLKEYKGVIILATNRSGDLDTAFIRGLRCVIDLPFPDKQDRERKSAVA